MARSNALIVAVALLAGCLPSDEERCASARAYVQERLVSLRARFVESRDRAARLQDEARARHELYGSYTARAQHDANVVRQIDAVGEAYAADDHAEVTRLIDELVEYDAVAAGHVASQQRSAMRFCN